MMSGAYFRGSVPQVVYSYLAFGGDQTTAKADVEELYTYGGPALIKESGRGNRVKIFHFGDYGIVIKKMNSEKEAEDEVRNLTEILDYVAKGGGLGGMIKERTSANIRNVGEYVIKQYLLDEDNILLEDVLRDKDTARVLGDIEVTELLREFGERLRITHGLLEAKYRLKKPVKNYEKEFMKKVFKKEGIDTSILNILPDEVYTLTISDPGPQNIIVSNLGKIAEELGIQYKNPLGLIDFTLIDGEFRYGDPLADVGKFLGYLDRLEKEGIETKEYKRAFLEGYGPLAKDEIARIEAYKLYKASQNIKSRKEKDYWKNYISHLLLGMRTSNSQQ